MENYLRAWRERAGLTLEEVGERVGERHKTTIQKVEARPHVRSDWLEKLAPIYGGHKPGELLEDPETLDRTTSPTFNEDDFAELNRLIVATLSMHLELDQYPGLPKILAGTVQNWLTQRRIASPTEDIRPPTPAADSRAASPPRSANARRGSRSLRT